MASTRQLVTRLTAVRTIHQSPLISWYHAAEIGAPRRPIASGESPDSPDTPGVEFREHSIHSTRERRSLAAIHRPRRNSRDRYRAIDESGPRARYTDRTPQSCPAPSRARAITSRAPIPTMASLSLLNRGYRSVSRRRHPTITRIRRMRICGALALRESPPGAVGSTRPRALASASAIALRRSTATRSAAAGSRALIASPPLVPPRRTHELREPPPHRARRGRRATTRAAPMSARGSPRTPTRATAAAAHRQADPTAGAHRKGAPDGAARAHGAPRQDAHVPSASHPRAGSPRFLLFSAPCPTHPSGRAHLTRALPSNTASDSRTATPAPRW